MMNKNRDFLTLSLTDIVLTCLTAFAAFSALAADQYDPQIKLFKEHVKFYGEISLKNIITILFLTIGPLKIIPPFAKLTANADTRLRNRLAFRSFWISTLTILAVAFMGQNMVANYRVSLTALLTAGGLVISLAALRSIMAQYEKHKDSDTQPGQPTLAMAITPISFPTIHPPYGIATVLLIMMIGQRIDKNLYLVIAIIVGYMVVNYVCMLLSHIILKFIKPAFLNVVGLVLSVIQLGIGITWIYGGIGVLAMSIQQMTSI